MKVFRTCLFFASCLSIISCSHLSEKIREIPIYSTKSRVLDKLGTPFQVTRKTGLDYWLYKIKKQKKTYLKPLIFRKGYLVKKGKEVSFPSPILVLEAAENLEEYKKAVKIYKTRKRR